MVKIDGSNWTLGLAALALCLCACDDQTQAEAAAEDRYQCMETVTVLQGLNTSLPGGEGEASHFLGMVPGSYNFVLRRPASQKPVTTFAPNSEGVKGTLVISADASPVRYINAKTPNLPKGVMLDVSCPNRVEMVVKASFRSEDGAFNAQWSSMATRILRGDRGQLSPNTTLNVEFAPNAGQGSFTIQTPAGIAPDQIESHRIPVEVSWGPGGTMQGKISADWTTKPVKEADGSVSGSATGMDIYDLVFESP